MPVHTVGATNEEGLATEPSAALPERRTKEGATKARKATKRRSPAEAGVQTSTTTTTAVRKAAKATKPPTSKRPAKKATAGRTKAAPAKSTAPRLKPGPKTTLRPLENPYRPGSNSYHYTEALKQGGKRSVIVRRLLRKIQVHPWEEGSEYGDVFGEVDKRLTMVLKQLERAYGWVVERRGRGSESYVKATPPSAKRATAKKS